MHYFVNLPWHDQDQNTQCKNSKQNDRFSHSTVNQSNAYHQNATAIGFCFRTILIIRARGVRKRHTFVDRSIRVDDYLCCALGAEMLWRAKLDMWWWCIGQIRRWWWIQRAMSCCASRLSHRVLTYTEQYKSRDGYLWFGKVLLLLMGATGWVGRREILQFVNENCSICCVPNTFCVHKKWAEKWVNWTMLVVRLASDAIGHTRRLSVSENNVPLVSNYTYDVIFVLVNTLSPYSVANIPNTCCISCSAWKANVGRTKQIWTNSRFDRTL